jgi:hypothetical protein
MPLSPPKPLDPNLSITRRSLGDQRQNSPKKDDPILVSSINHISSPDTNTALLVSIFFLCTCATCTIFFSGASANNRILAIFEEHLDVGPRERFHACHHSTVETFAKSGSGVGPSSGKNVQEHFDSYRCGTSHRSKQMTVRDVCLFF